MGLGPNIHTGIHAYMWIVMFLSIYIYIYIHIHTVYVQRSYMYIDETYVWCMVCTYVCVYMYLDMSMHDMYVCVCMYIHM